MVFFADCYKFWSFMLVFVLVLRQYLCQEARQHHATSDQCSKASHLPIVSYGSWRLAPMHHTPQEQIPCNRPSIFFPHVCSCASVSATLQWEKLHSSGGGARNVKSFGLATCQFISSTRCAAKEPQLQSFCNHGLCCIFFVVV